ncbi:hypothetical protein [Rhodopirellula sp. MGV]|uniref:hypothetical protein n=1 Tax=Rhodopirellula sp. MGV TaxID=2023130 RepID=UPI000B967822|nr:hypothetical protein [Rhodopirellula sp. MGV]OYP34394.1 hypothetical protein CGZ80_15165 [Rhodopirellula sp. MGV]PNY37432.1 hypothetical protein C2E31_07860 [Rhodopirellula baltica]
MRLTLRTLLAYLDDTLEPRDREDLREKLERSGQASQLVQAIRASITKPDLSAPAPDSVHPTEDANMMSDYLDSTLSPEQTAEIEKACMDSLSSLAEAGACHQILTMVLGRPAKTTDQLRNRIFSMVDVDGNVRATESQLFADGGAGRAIIAGEIGPGYSSIEMGETEGSTGTDAEIEDVPPASFEDTNLPLPNSVTQVSGSPVSPPPAILPNQTTMLPEVKPVGVDDSGVFKAGTKLREQSAQFAEIGNYLDDGIPLAGARPLRELERSDFYEGDVRPSRITPWLVSLGLAAVLLFAISQVFAPLIGPQASKQDTDAKMSDLLDDDQTVPSADDTAVVADDPESTNPSDESQPVKTPDSEAENETSELPAEPVGDATVVDDVAESTPEMEVIESEVEVDFSAPPVPPSDPIADAATEEMDVAETADPVMSTPAVPATAPDAVIADASMATEAEPDMADVASVDPATLPTESDLVPAEAPDAGAIGDGEAIATFKSDNALVGIRVQDDWKLLAPNDQILQGQTVACGPEFRATFQIGEREEKSLVMIGASQVALQRDGEQTVLETSFGKGVVQLADAGDSVVLRTRDIAIVATAESGATSFAYSLQHRRGMGADPMLPENHQAELQLVGLEGDTSFVGEIVVAPSRDDLRAPGDFTLSSNQSIELLLGEESSAIPTVQDIGMLPPWVNAEIDTGSLEAQAASDLLELVRSDKADSLTLALRVALGFRRNEVAALAGKSMLALGDASAYFGVDGLFSVGKQRLYWSSHLDAVREMLDRSVADARAVRTAIAGENAAIDNADGDTLFKLLVGYSQEQLKQGGDEELVNDLESASIPVRVLASENLRDISGTTLFFRPEEEVESRREDVVKKWKVRLKKESIRYGEGE